jgi:mono/diheme cytochrome c family protein
VTPFARFASLAILASAVAACRVRNGDSGGGATDAAADSSAATGALAVSAYGCAQCHQPSDPADGVLSGQTIPVPGSQAYGSNLTPDPDTGMDAWEAGTIATAILQARDNLGNPLCPQMPAYEDAGMSEEVAAAIAVYLQGIPAVWHPVPPSVCPPIKGAADAGADGGP